MVLQWAILGSHAPSLSHCFCRYFGALWAPLALAQQGGTLGVWLLSLWETNGASDGVFKGLFKRESLTLVRDHHIIYSFLGIALYFLESRYAGVMHTGNESYISSHGQDTPLALSAGSLRQCFTFILGWMKAQCAISTKNSLGTFTEA